MYTACVQVYGDQYSAIAKLTSMTRAKVVDACNVAYIVSKPSINVHSTLKVLSTVSYRACALLLRQDDNFHPGILAHEEIIKEVRVKQSLDGACNPRDPRPAAM